MPALPLGVAPDGTLIPAPRAAEEPAAPYQRIAAGLRAAIMCGALGSGDLLPTEKVLAERYGVAVSTAHRAIAELTSAGLVVASRGKRAAVAKRRTESTGR
jgi:integrase